MKKVIKIESPYSSQDVERVEWNGRVIWDFVRDGERRVTGFKLNIPAQGAIELETVETIPTTQE